MGNNEIADALEGAADLIEPEGKWTQGASARNAAGESLNSAEEGAVRFCALGAILKSGGGRIDADDYFGDYVNPGNAWAGIGLWNDKKGRTQAEVVAALREAATLARTSGEVS